MTTTTHRSRKPLSKGATRTVRVRVERCEGPGNRPFWEEFSVPVTAGEGANIISALQWIAANPVTADGKQTTPVAFDSGCLEEVCGSCTMVINGRVRQSCSCLLDNDAPNDGDTITLQPMSKFPVVRDLWVDRSRVFHNLKRIKAWVPIDGLYSIGPGPRETPDHQQERYALSTCMSCGCCLEACPQFQKEERPEQWNTAFVGAQTIAQVRYFNTHQTGKELARERLDVMIGPGGVADCGNAQNCLQVCPKEIPLTEAIAAVGREATLHGLRKFFGGR